MLIDAVIPGDRNVIKKNAEKISNRIQCILNGKANVMTVITGATGTISKSLRAIYQESRKLRN